VILLEKRKRKEKIGFFNEGPPPRRLSLCNQVNIAICECQCHPYFSRGLSGNEYRAHVILAKNGDTLTRAFGH
jgi:hypothetical protein